ncbi:HNH endonuclease [Clostridium beijerinckii]|uniref:HNH endonuclease n=1 Tax=Clostridium beijerinckii TaxID=1520 RepID=UPI001570B843|nr:HNH endonuclease signature motif containing protein [Clostridium beijerinckii]NRT70026.1 5-methylcytosine-specific restriction endonuclease McrA [Clostridium beijerinckii]
MEKVELLQWINKLIQYHNIKALYNNSLWQYVRSKALERDNNECQKCKSKGIYSKAQCVHHKEHVRKRPELALTLDNLISLCNSCHDEEHPEKLNNKPKPQLNEERW